MIELQFVVPHGIMKELDVDDIRSQIEDFVEQLVLSTTKVVDERCEPSSTTIYSTNTAWARRVDFCLGRISDGAHIHGKTEYGANTWESWVNVQVGLEEVSE